MGSSLRVHWMLHEAGLEYETKSVDLSKGEHKQPEFLAINPAGQIPAVDIDGMRFAESVAIVQYLAETHKPELLGATPEVRAKSMQWALWALLNPQKPMLDLAMQVWRNAPDEATSKIAHETLSKQLPVLENLLSTQTYVAGSEFTIGDLVACVSFTYGKTGGVDLSVYPNITRWMQDCMSRPAFLASTAS